MSPPQGISQVHVPRAKIEIPDFPQAFVHRVEPAAILDKVDPNTVVLICAPAGYGKTLALADWVRNSPETDTAWVSVDSDDNDAPRLWSSILRALAGCPSIPTESAIRHLVPTYPTIEPGFLADVVDALDELPAPIRLVLDDVHELTDAAALHSIETLVRNHPGGLQLVLGGRLDPALPLSRLRLEGRLFELRPPQLEFSVPDATALLESSGVFLERDQVETLVDRTEGWAAGLRLAALSLRGVADPERFLADFSGDEKSVADYLFGEVLSRLSPEKVDFLRVVSICDGLTPGLANAVSGRTDAGALLAGIERETSLVVSTGRHRHGYRMHSLLRSHLRADLDRRRPHLAESLHAAAADWYAADNQPARALDHATAAGDPERVSRLLHHYAVPLTLRGDHRILTRALSAVGTPTDPWLALVTALLHLDSPSDSPSDSPNDAANQAEAGRDLARADAGWPEDAPAALVNLRRIIELRRARAVGDLTAALQAAGDIAEQPLDEPDLRALALVEQGTAQLHGPDRAEAHRNVELALALANRSGWDRVTLRCLIALGTLAGWEGDYVEMRRLADEAVDLATARGWQSGPWCSTPYAMRGYACLLRLEPVPALAEIELAGAASGDSQPPRALLATGMIRGAALFDSGDRLTGLREMQDARSEYGQGTLVPEQCASLASLEYRAALALGRGIAARTVLGWAATYIRNSGDLRLMRAWGQLLAGHPRTSRRLLQPVIAGDLPMLARVNEVDAWLLEVLLALSAGERTAARRALTTALEVAAAGDVIRPFALTDAGVRDLLASQLGSYGPQEPFAERVLAAVSAQHAGERTALELTERELTVLHLLPSLWSLEEIAAELNVSLNTVKTHVRAIYAKLGVSNRRSAVLAARHHGIL